MTELISRNPESNKDPVYVGQAVEATPELVEAARNLVPELESSNQVEITQEYVNEIIKASGNHLLVARNNERKVSGLAVLVTYPVLTNKRALIETIVVDQNQRSKGVAKSLLKEALRIADSEGVNTVRLATGKDNPANKLFIETGFVTSQDYNWYDYILKEGPRA